MQINIENLKEYKFIYNNITNVLHSKNYILEIIHWKSHKRNHITKNMLKNYLIENAQKKTCDR